MFTNESSFTKIFFAKNAKGAKVFLGELGVFARENVFSCLVSLRLGLARLLPTDNCQLLWNLQRLSHFQAGRAAHTVFLLYGAHSGIVFQCNSIE